MFCNAHDANYNLNNKNNFNPNFNLSFSISKRRNLWKTPPKVKNGGKLC